MTIEGATTLPQEQARLSADDLYAQAFQLERSGERSRAIPIYEEILSVASARRATAQQVAMAILRIAAIHAHNGSRDIALELAEVAVFIAAANGLDDTLAHGLVAQSTIHSLDGDLAGAETLARAGRVQAEAAGVEIAVAIADNVLGICASRRGDVSAALLRFASALAYGQRAGDLFPVSMCLTNIGRAYLALGMPEEAIPRYEEAAAIALEHPHIASVIADAALATMCADGGDVDKAARHADRALRQAINRNSPESAANGYTAAACAAIAAGKLRVAEGYVRVAETLVRRIADIELEGELAICSMSLHISTGKIGLAFADAERAERAHMQVPDNWGSRRLSQRRVELAAMIDDQNKRWLTALSAHVPHSGRHARRVAQLSWMISALLKLSDFERRPIDVGSLLCDIGMLSVPVDLARRTDVLTSLERDILRAHAEFGAERLLEAGFPPSVVQIVRHHHERWDGLGYPDGLRGEQIPLGARITAIAARYDALRSRRGARPELSESSALRRLESEAGSALDPHITEQFVRAIRSGYEPADGQGGMPITEAPDAGRSTDAELGGFTPNEIAIDFAKQIAKTLGNRYEIVRELEGAGMAHVYLATDKVLARAVVVKAVHSDDIGASGAARFRREMALAARIRHPNVLPILDARVEAPLLYFITPFIDGGSLRGRIERGTVPLDEAIRILREVASALAAAHAEGVVHRDLKPENILLGSARDSRSFLADFGIARLIDMAPAIERPTLGARLTHTGVSLGTPDYMAPEQVFAQTELDARVDVYAFGLVAYELLTGTRPFVRSTAREVMVAHLTVPAPRTEIARPDVPPRLANLIARSLEKAPDDRYADATELLAELDAL